ncbi:ABC transporter permease subunit [Turicibacter sanguinis]|uniref:ABC transporter permease n=1 Tax=Turicibacter sanguinis TaxID=154288 RepID=UPI0012BC6645|nr:ABC transporter permease subunit [Turicibacter sanguinis]MDB8439143.1 ABC transporter permease subunit [Turicibacter sanguinis]MDB8565192.1 ABC transporter permease subunit [Turicibacter sanguinis]MTO25034.1 ABC transporter permease subunit [Turicibacter sanguinis]MTO28012.1 ABC transporter permease subunit [Turicibacter sanguinis]MTO90951.1 ABC transporter permease subunit [Turicibacter sanguinis]
MRGQSTMKKNKFLQNYQLYLMLLPTIIFIFIFCYIPMYGVLMAFQDYTPSAGIWGSEWVGFDHFTRFITNFRFEELLSNTFILSFVGFLVGFPLPILLALMINALTNRRFQGFVKTVLYAPHFISVVVLVGMLYIFFGEYGLVNSIIQAFGGESISFFLEKSWFRPLFIGSGNWQDMGWSAIIYLAALAGVDPQVHEAAIVDGATRWQRILHVDLPAIFPTVSVMLILSIGSIMGVGHEKVLLMQTGANLGVSEIISTYVYKAGLIDYDYGYAAAIGLFNSVINVVLLVFANRMAKKFSENSLW